MDGSETTEAIAAMVSLSELGFEVSVFAPEGAQADVVDHQTVRALGYAPRNIIQESARLSRGNVLPLQQLSASEFDCLVVPGGFGAAKNLCNWASAAAPQDCEAKPEMRSVLEAFYEQKKPIALCCIAPVLAAVVFKTKQVIVTVGGAEAGEDWPYAGTVGQLKSIGAKPVECKVGEVCVDTANKLVTSPAYMSGTAKKHEVFFGVRRMIRELAWLV